ncbi:hypothetical protein GCM10007868_29770 [Gluconobacter frateurii]|uniref:Uncharacterized protein n=1 Tax=Gluconobacter frateurii NRIC 0228 TaxID=1307946 RepID=A0ABQ0Q960_9PROT|nr:hypothetical protein AA0228_0735 [Gluconobacter frateurii NRIC 0228]GLP91902.1 hypothetical protein GCM10007868_29770 [Gluconobacter frateurii]
MKDTEPAAEQSRVICIADADCCIEAFVDQIHFSIRKIDVEFNVGVTPNEFRERW